MKKLFVLTLLAIISMACIAQTRFDVGFDTNIYKYRNGCYDTVYIFKYMDIDTVYVVNGNGDTINFTIDSNIYNGVNMCLGDTIKVSAFGLYDSVRNSSVDATTLATWIFGDGTSIDYVPLTQYITYTEVGCYDLEVVLYYDTMVSSTGSIRIRIADNPVKRIYDFGAICSTDSMLLNIGYSSDDFIMLKEIEFAESVTKEYAVKTFIPDGMNQCPTACFTADVNFTEFPNGRNILSADDICSVCINMEHSFMGDIRMSLVCPSGQKAVLKYGTPGYDQNIPTGAPTGSFGGSGQYLGIPYGGSSDSPYDNLQHNYCDSVYNMYGEGYTYCFSRNGDYTFASGNPANTNTLTTDDYIASTNQTYLVQLTNYNFQTIPAPYVNAGTTANPSTFRTKRPSDHDNKSDYYAPAEDFSSLIGCPLNGNWSIEICDFWPADNGWVFSWNMDICGISHSSCEYQVGIDTVIWTADDNLNFNYRDSITATISSDTAGVFPMRLSIYDDFGCVWNNSVPISIVQTPEPHLGNDTAFCKSESIVLDATDRYTDYHNTYSYKWEPNGNETSTVIVAGESGTEYLYIVEVTNTKYNKHCKQRDSVYVRIKNHPRLSFESNTIPLEGCEPFNLTFNNSSSNVVSYRWDFGDGEYSFDRDAHHSYSEGIYTLKYYGESYEGCKDSLVFVNLIEVFSKPKAQFSWGPVFPTVTNPYVAFNNQSTGTDNIYRWEIQYDKDYPYSYHTLTSESPLFAWVTNGEDISGQYIARLIAKTTNIGTSGHQVVCVDTTENLITLVNDFIQFPNVVTPNGDGVNDVFVIKNLLSGGYPTNALWIYNEWGSLVFKAENISDESGFWDPNKTNSPDGTYFFRFSGVGYTGNVERKGVIEVIR